MFMFCRFKGPEMKYVDCRKLLFRKRKIFHTLYEIFDADD